MMRLLASLFIKLLILTCSVQGQQLFFSEDLALWVNGEIRSASINQTDFSSLLESLTDQGYFEARIDSTTPTTIYLSTGPSYNLRQLIYKDEQEGTWYFESTQPYETSLVEAYSNHVLHELRNKGFAFAEIALSQTTIDSVFNLISIYFDVHKKEKVLIEVLRFNGASGLSDSYLMREAGFVRNSVYTPEIIQNYIDRLQQSRFITNVQSGGLVETESGWEFLFTLEQTRRNAIDLVAGYNPSAVSSSAFVGRGDLRLDNLIAEGSSARFQFERLPEERSRLELGYSQYWIASLPLFMAADARFIQHDSTYIQSQIQVDLGYNITSRLTVGVLFSTAYMTTSHIMSAPEIQPGSNRSIGISIGYSTLNRRFNPTAGFRTLLLTKTGFRSLLPGADAVYDKRYAVNEIHFESQYYQPITSRWILVPRINAQAVQSDVYFDDQLIRFGGALSMRGFREEQFRANRLVWTDIEGRFLLDRFSYVFLFGATGYFSAPDQQGIPFSTIQSTVLNSAGFGLSYRIPLGMLQFSYAVSTQSSLSNGMVHFGIINSF